MGDRVGLPAGFPDVAWRVRMHFPVGRGCRCHEMTSAARREKWMGHRSLCPEGLALAWSVVDRVVGGMPGLRQRTQWVMGLLWRTLRRLTLEDSSVELRLLVQSTLEEVGRVHPRWFPRRLGAGSWYRAEDGRWRVRA